ncbi:MAG: hypothetical protein ACRDQ1_19605, partial [Sciscionella sp.]
MTPLTRAGAGCLVVGPLAGLASVLTQRSVSLHAGDLAAAYVTHPTATHLGLGINTVGTVLTAAGLLWLAWTTYPRA